MFIDSSVRVFFVKPVLLIFLNCTTIILSCNDKKIVHARGLLPEPQKVTLTRADSFLILKTHLKAVHIDSTMSNSGCKMEYRYFDTSQNLLVQEIRQDCHSDSRAAVKVNRYYSKDKKLLLGYSVDLMGNILEIERE